MNEKQKYIEISKRDKERYQKELEEYNKHCIENNENSSNN